MAIDPVVAARDMYEMDFRDPDQRIALGNWVFYVRGVKRRSELLGARWIVADGSNVLMWLTLPVVHWAKDRIDRRRPWQVGVVRLGNVASWESVQPVVAHLETVSDPDPSRRMAELCDQVRAGGFMPGT